MTAPIIPPTSTPSLVPGTQFVIDPNIAESQNIKVAVRIRPMQDAESARDDDKNKKRSRGADKKAWTLSKGSNGLDVLTQVGAVRKVEGRSLFQFDQIFDEETQTPLLYKSIARQMVKSVVGGRHATIFAYGQTGSGKTFTMQGDGKAASGQAGIIQLVASDVFRSMKQGVAAKRDYLVKVSYIEIYNEKIRDLLGESNGSAHSGKLNTSTDSGLGGGTQPEVTIRTTGSGEIALNCQQTPVSSVDEVLDLLISGNGNRVVASTDMNQHSSRSHAIFRITVESREKGAAARDLSNEIVRVADFNLVDLAGSENCKASGTSGQRQREGAMINQSLLSLSSVIHSLSLPAKKKPKHINYRDSKLTRILQPHLSGNAEMAILCCVSPSKAYLEETRSTLKFAARAKLVEMKPKINEVLDDGALIKKLQWQLAEARKENKKLKEKLAKYESGSPPDDDSEPDLGYGDPAKDDGDPDMGYGDSAHGSDPAKLDQPDYGYGESKSSELGLGYGSSHGASNNRPYVMPKDQDMGSMPTGMNNRQYVMPKNQDMGSMPPGGGVNRPYVMPKNQDMGSMPSGGNRAYVMPKNQDLGSMPTGNSNRQYVMPKNQDLGSMPTGNSNRQYVMPKNQDLGSMPTTPSSFQLDSVDPDQAKQTVFRYMQGRSDTEDSQEFAKNDSQDEISDIMHANSFDNSNTNKLSQLNSFDFPTPAKQLNSFDFPMPAKQLPSLSGGRPHEITGLTAPTDDDVSSAGQEASYAEASLKFGSALSMPPSLLEDYTFSQASTTYDDLQSDYMMGGRGKALSFDTDHDKSKGSKSDKKELIPLPGFAKKDLPLPEEIMIIRDTPVDGEVDNGITTCLIQAENKAKFYSTRIEMSEDMVEALFGDLEKARLCIHDLVFRNVNLASKLKSKKKIQTIREYEESLVVLENLQLLRAAMIMGLFFIAAGGYEGFMGTVFFIWLVVEQNVISE